MVTQESASIRQRSFAAGVAEMPSFPAAVGRLNDVHVNFNKDLLDETELGFPVESLNESHRRLSKFRQDPVSGMRHSRFSLTKECFAFQKYLRETRSYRSTANKTLAAHSTGFHRTVAANANCNAYLPPCLLGMAYSLVGG